MKRKIKKKNSKISQKSLLPKIFIFKRLTLITSLTVILVIITLIFTNSHLLVNASGTNILSNPGCETGTSGYTGYQAKLSTTSIYAHSGSYSCVVTSTGGNFYDIQSTQSFANPNKGQSYTASSWVRSATNTKNTVYVAITESGGSNAAKTVYGPAVTLSTQWQLVSNTYIVSSTGRTSLNFYVVQNPGSKGQSFYIDDLAFMLNVNSTVTPVPTTNPTPTVSTIPVSVIPTPTLSFTPTPTLGTTPVPLGIPGNWKILFDDEFNGTSLDTTKWAPYWFSNGSTQNGTKMESSNVNVSGGFLNLTDTGNTGGLVSTNPKAGGNFQFTYGAVEARIYLPASGSEVANWPAFWTDGQSWPTDGEMDVMEGLGGSACYHFHDTSGGPGGCVTGNFSGWHTYGADWQPGTVSYYYDGTKVGTISSGITSQPMYLILENSLGSPSINPATMQVDYMRVWQ